MEANPALPRSAAALPRSAAAAAAVRLADNHLARYAPSTPTSPGGGGEAGGDVAADATTGQFRAETSVSVVRTDPFTGETRSSRERVVVGFYPTAKEAQDAIAAFRRNNGLDGAGGGPEDGGAGDGGQHPHAAPYVDPMDPDMLYKKVQVLTSRLHRRALLLERLRSQYLKDVVLVKEQVLCRNAGGVDGTLKFKVPADRLPCVRGLPPGLIKRMLPRFDLRKSLPLFCASEDCPDNTLLSITPCTMCGGTCDIVQLDEVATKVLRDAYMKLAEEHRITCDNLKASRSTVAFLQGVVRERSDESNSATYLVRKLRKNVRRLLEDAGGVWTGLKGADTKQAEAREKYLWEENRRVELAAEESEARAQRAVEEARRLQSELIESRHRCRSLAKESAARADAAASLGKRLDDESRARVAAEIESQQLAAEVAATTAARDAAVALHEVSSKKSAALAESKAAETRRRQRGLEAKLRKEELRGVRDRKTTGRKLLLTCMRHWGVGRNRRAFTRLLRHARDAREQERQAREKKLMREKKHVHKMLMDARRHLATEHALRVGAVSREAGLLLALQKRDDRVAELRRRQARAHRRSMAQVQATEQGLLIVNESLRRASMVTEGALRAHNASLSSRAGALSARVVADGRRAAILGLVSSAVQVARATVVLDTDKRARLARAEALAVERATEWRRTQRLRSQRECAAMQREEARQALHATESLLAGARAVAARQARALGRVTRAREVARMQGEDLRCRGATLQATLAEERARAQNEMHARDATVARLETAVLNAEELRVRLEGAQAAAVAELEGQAARLREELALTQGDGVELAAALRKTADACVRERRRRNQLFEMCATLMANVLASGTAGEDIDHTRRADRRVEREHVVPGRLSWASMAQARAGAHTTLPKWCKSVLVVESEDEDGDITTLQKDCERSCTVAWETATARNKLDRRLATALKQLRAAETSAERANKKMRKMTLCMPSEKRRRVNAAMKRMPAAKARRALGAVRAFQTAGPEGGGSGGGGGGDANRPAESHPSVVPRMVADRLEARSSAFS